MGGRNPRIVAQEVIELHIRPVFIADDGSDLDWLCGQPMKLRAPFGALVQLLGPPLQDVPEKCSTMWSLHGAGGNVVLMDWQDEDDRRFDVNAFRNLPAYDWEVFATDEQVAIAFCRWLSAQVIAKLSEAKTLSPEGRVELNRLMKEGMHLAEALKRVPMQPPPDVAKRFAWPINNDD